MCNNGAKSPEHFLRFVLWMDDKMYGVCSMSSDRLTHTTRLSLPMLLIGD